MNLKFLQCGSMTKITSMSPFDNPEVVALLRDLDLRPSYRLWPASAKCAYDNFVLTPIAEQFRKSCVNWDSSFLSRRNRCKSIQNVFKASYNQLSIPFEQE